MTKIINTELTFRVSVHYVAEIDLYEVTLKRTKKKCIITCTKGESEMLKEVFELSTTEE